MTENTRPIGVFDSGIGGLTVVSALRSLLPNESIFYLGDTARVPYGGKSASTVQRYSLEIAALLLEENAKAIVVACNTASAVALSLLSESVPVPVTGVIVPGARAAIAATRMGHIGVIGTRATIGSGAYERALRSLNPDVQVTARSCPLLVPLIEEGWLEHPITDQILMQYLDPLLKEGIDTLVLGCTHYPLLRPAMERLLGNTITLVDSAQNCANAVRELLASENLSAGATNPGLLQVALTDRPDNFLRVAREALRLDVGDVQLREVAAHAPL
jgi:glutamate racemase